MTYLQDNVQFKSLSKVVNFILTLSNGHASVERVSVSIKTGRKSAQRKFNC